MVEESISKKSAKQLVRINLISIKDTVLLGKMLMNEQNFKSAKDVDGLIPHAPGLYCIRIKIYVCSRNHLLLFFWREGIIFFISVLHLKICTSDS